MSCPGFSLCYVRDLVCVMCSLQSVLCAVFSLCCVQFLRCVPGQLIDYVVDFWDPPTSHGVGLGGMTCSGCGSVASAEGISNEYIYIYTIICIEKSRMVANLLATEIDMSQDVAIDRCPEISGYPEYIYIYIYLYK